MSAFNPPTSNVVLAVVAPGVILNRVSAGVLCQYVAGDRIPLPKEEYDIKKREGLVL